MQSLRVHENVRHFEACCQAFAGIETRERRQHKSDSHSTVQLASVVGVCVTVEVLGSIYRVSSNGDEQSRHMSHACRQQSFDLIGLSTDMHRIVMS